MRNVATCYWIKHEKQVIKNVSKEKMEGLLEVLWLYLVKKRKAQFMKESLTTNQKPQGWRVINFLERFMTILGKKQRIMRILESVKQG